MSFGVQTYRIGDESTPAGKTDRKLIDLNAALVDTLSSSTDATVVSSVTAELIRTYGASNVTTSAATMSYKWVWDPEEEIWILVCTGSTTALVNDDEDDEDLKPVSVQIAIQQSVV